MNIEQVREYTLSLYGVTEDQPFGDDIITFRLEGKIFVCLWLGGGKHDMKNSEPRLALKLSPENEMSGQMKTLIDRMNAMYELDYQFRDVYLLTTAADNDENTPKRAESGLTGWIDCYPKSRIAGTLFCGGVNSPREIEGNPKLQEAFELGKSV